MKNNQIQSFSIYGLFGTDDVHIPFEENVKILIGENGLGKTQILDIFYYALSRNFVRLSEYYFEKIGIKTETENIEIYKKDILNIIDNQFINPIIKNVIELIGIKELLILRNEIAHGQLSRPDFRRHRLYEKLNGTFDIDEIYDILLLNLDKIKLLFDFDKLLSPETVSNMLGQQEIVYIPTFRQIKEHVKWYNGENYAHIEFEKNNIIAFGMDDVEDKFRKMEKKINRFLAEGLSEISLEVLQFVVGNSEKTVENPFDNIHLADVEIILSRVGNQLSVKQKEEIRNVISKNEVKNQTQVYFIQKLTKIYEKQRTIDEAIKAFRDKCNKYLVDKAVFYDESNIKIAVKSQRNEAEIPLSKLSSGEKQIIAILAKIYLSNDNERFMVLFDEPELSLSVFWQREFLPDIMDSGKCDFLLAVTHSPFIFENNLDRYAIGLGEYVHPISNKVAI